MEKSKVYFTTFKATGNENLLQKLHRLMKTAGFENIDFMHVCNFEKISIENVKMANYRGEAFIKTWSEGKIEMKDLICDCEEDQLVVKAKEPFFAKAI